MPTRRLGHESTTAAISAPCSTRRWRSPTGTASRRARRRARARGKLRGLRHRQLPRSDRAAGKEMGGIRFEPDGGVTMLTGTLDYGQGHASPFAQVLTEPARHSLRTHPPHAGRQRPAAGRRRHRRLALGHGRAARPRGGERAGDRAGQADRRPRARGLGRRHRVRAGRFTIAGTDRSIGMHGAGRSSCATGWRCRRTLPQTLDVSHVSDTPPSAFPNGCHVCRDRDRSRYRHDRGGAIFMVNDFGKVINPMLVAGQAHGGVVQGIGQAIWSAPSMTRRPAPDRLLHGLRHAARRQRAACSRSRAIRCRRRPIRWASRAAARPAAPARCPR